MDKKPPRVFTDEEQLIIAAQLDTPQGRALLSVEIWSAILLARQFPKDYLHPDPLHIPEYMRSEYAHLERESEKKKIRSYVSREIQNRLDSGKNNDS